MTLIVQKFGGTSVGDLDRIRKVADRIVRERAHGHQLVVVLSAMSGETNRLIAMGEAMAEQPEVRELDQLAATGEQVTIALLAICLNGRGVPAVSLQGWQAGIHTEDVFGKARIEHIDTTRMKRELDAGKVVIVAGFQGVTALGDVTTLGRGGSDTTAVALAAALHAAECQIFTDVDGVYTTDPRVVPQAHRLDSVPFPAMMEMASQGSKVLQTRSVEFAGKYNVPVRVLSSFSDGPGTLITTRAAMEAPVVSGIAFSQSESLILISGLRDHPLVTAEMFSALSAAHIETDMLTQTHRGQQRTDFGFTVARKEGSRALAVLRPLVEREQGTLALRADVAKVSVIGMAMRTHPVLASRLFEALAAGNIAIMAITTAETRLSVLVSEQDMNNAVCTLHTAFGLDRADS